jgi:hypothetical protein
MLHGVGAIHWLQIYISLNIGNFCNIEWDFDLIFVFIVGPKYIVSGANVLTQLLLVIWNLTDLNIGLFI